MKCVICGKDCENAWGNNPWPLEDKGVCCDRCNRDLVIPARIARMVAQRRE